MEATATGLLYPEPVNSLPPSSPLPAIIIHDPPSPEAIARFNSLATRVFQKEPLTVIFRQEREETENKPYLETLLDPPALIIPSIAARTKRKLDQGGFIISAANWSAAAIWDPPAASSLNVGPVLSAEERARRPVFAGFNDGIAAARERYMGPGARFWHLSLMLRDPSVQPPVKGAVRAVIEPLMQRAEAEGLPVWIEAGGARARDVYGYMGFELLEEMRNGKGTHRSDGYLAADGEDAPGVPTWFMIYNRPRLMDMSNGGDDTVTNGTHSREKE